jgi:hypothetical protein
MTENAETEAQLKQRIAELEFAARAAAEARWDARHQAAVDAFKMPTHQHRIRHDFEENEWVCEEAAPFVRAHVEDADGNSVDSGWDPLTRSSFYTAEQYDADTAGFAVSVTWNQIGPREYRPPVQAQSGQYVGGVGGGVGGGGGGWGIVGHAGYYETLSFSTYDEAEAWLRRYLKPVEEIVYFTAAGDPVKPGPKTIGGSGIR